jgi:hypothetical protein
MYLILFTFVYCLVTQLFNVPYELAFGLILVTLAFFKGYLSHEKSNICNLESTKKLYKKNGLKDSLIEFLCLLIIFINPNFIEYEPFNALEYANIILLFVLIYRFLFWGTIRTFRESDPNLFQKS